MYVAAIANATLAIGNLVVGIVGIGLSEWQKGEVSSKISDLKDLYETFKPLATTLSNDDIDIQNNATTTLLANTNNIKISTSLSDAKYLTNKTTDNILAVKGINYPVTAQDRTDKELLALIESEINPVVQSLALEILTLGLEISGIILSGIFAAKYTIDAKRVYKLNKPSANEDIPEIQPLNGNIPSEEEVVGNARVIEKVSKFTKTLEWGTALIQAISFFMSIYQLIASSKQFNEVIDHLNTSISKAKDNIKETNKQITTAEKDQKLIEDSFKKLDKSIFGIQASIKSLDQYKLDAGMIQAKGGTYYDSNKKAIDTFANITYGDYFNMTHDTVVGSKDNFISGQTILLDFFRINKTSLIQLSDWAAIMRQIQIGEKSKLPTDVIFQFAKVIDPNLTKKAFDVLKKFVDEGKFNDPKK